MSTTSEQQQHRSSAASSSPSTVGSATSPMTPASLFTSELYNRVTTQGLAGAGAGAVSAVMVHPLDTVKARLQLQGIVEHPKYVGTIGTLRTIFYEEGIRGCYRSLTMNLVALVPTMAVYFTSYDTYKYLLTHTFHPDPASSIHLPKSFTIVHHPNSNPITNANNNTNTNTNKNGNGIQSTSDSPPSLRTPPLSTADILIQMTAAFGAWVTASTLTNPLWLVKIRMQTAPLFLHPPNPLPTPSPSPPGVVGSVSGVSGGGAIGTMVHGGLTGSAIHGIHSDNNPHGIRHCDSIKYRNAAQSFRTILQENGMRGFYVGLRASYFGSLLAMVQFPLYEHLKIWISHSIPSVALVPIRPSPSATFSSSSSPSSPSFSPTHTDDDHDNNNLDVPALDVSSSPTISGEPTSLIHHHNNELHHVSAVERYHLHPLALAISSATSMAAGVLLTYPQELVRSRIQTTPSRYFTFVQAFRLVLKEEGARGLYCGMFANLIRLMPACAISFTTYEVFLRVLSHQPPSTLSVGTPSSSYASVTPVELKQMSVAASLSISPSSTTNESNSVETSSSKDQS